MRGLRGFEGVGEVEHESLEEGVDTAGQPLPARGLEQAASTNKHLTETPTHYYATQHTNSKIEWFLSTLFGQMLKTLQ